MPGVYTITLDSDSFPGKPKVLVSLPMEGTQGRREGGERDLGRGGSPLIDLTSRSPSPSLPPPTSGAALKQATPAVMQLSLYAQPGQTRVHATVPAIQPRSSPPPPPQMEKPLLVQQQQPLPPATTATRRHGEQIVNTTTTKTLTPPPPTPQSAVDVVAVSKLSFVPTTETQPTTASPSGMTQSSHPPPPPPPPPPYSVSQQSLPKGSGTTRSVDSVPPALVEFFGSTPISTPPTTNGPQSELPPIKREPLQYEARKPSSPSSDVTGTNKMLPVPTASVQVGVVSPEPSATEEFPRLRMKSSVGGEEGEEGMEREEEEGRRGEGEEEEEGRRRRRREPGPRESASEGDSGGEHDPNDMEMELRIEDSMQAEGGRDASERETASDRVSAARAGNKVEEEEHSAANRRGTGVLVRVVRGQREDATMSSESESNSNSIGTSTSPLIEVRGHVSRRHSSVLEQRLSLQIEEEEEEEEEEEGEELSRVSPQLMRVRTETYDDDAATGRNNGEMMKIHAVVGHGGNPSPSIIMQVKGSVATVSPSLPCDNGRGAEEMRSYRGSGGGAERDKGGMLPSTSHNGDVLSGYRVRKVAKVKQFFTTLQHFGNKQSSEVAEQVQELIAALVNGTATIEEFHQEIQTVTNHPLRQFIIPFLRENLDLFREALHDSEQALSSIIPPSSSPSSSSSSQHQATIAVTPVIIDDDLPVLPPSSKPPLTPTLTNSLPSSSSSPPSHLPSAEPTVHYHSSNSKHQKSVQSQTVPVHSTATMTFEPPSDSDSAPYSSSSATRRKHRHPSTERLPVGATSDAYTPTSAKRLRPDMGYSHVAMDTAVSTTTTSSRHGHGPPPGPAYPSAPYLPGLTSHLSQHSPGGGGSGGSHSSDHTHTTQGHTLTQVLYQQQAPPPPPPTLPRVPATATPGSSRRHLLAEDWAHVDMMLNSVSLMAQKARDALAMMKERVLNSCSDLEKREQEQQRLAEETEKARRHWQEERIHIQRETARKIKEAVAQVKVEMEQKIAQAQSLAVQETLKEASTQTNSKESCWNCGRRATETCSGCNKARYCGTFCQHKDWGSHMHHCASGIMGIADERSGTAGGGAHVIIQSGDTLMTPSIALSQEEPPDIKPRISPEQLMNVQQIAIRYPMT